MSGGVPFPWPDFLYPHGWHDDELLCVHFSDRSPNPSTWTAQSSFWSDAIRSYAQQLSDNCPFRHRNKLSFTATDLITAYRWFQPLNTSSHHGGGVLEPLPIIDVLCQLIDRNQMLQRSHLFDTNSQSAIVSSNNTQSYSDETSDDSVSTGQWFASSVGGIVTSMFSYVTSGGVDDPYSLGTSGIKKSTKNGTTNHTRISPIHIDKDTYVVHIPTIQQLCERIHNLCLDGIQSHLVVPQPQLSPFQSPGTGRSVTSISPSPTPAQHKDAFAVASYQHRLTQERRRSLSQSVSVTPSNHSGRSSQLDLTELLQAGLHVYEEECTQSNENHSRGGVIMSSIVFTRVCQELFGLTANDIALVKRYMSENGSIRICSKHEYNQSNNNSTDTTTKASLIDDEKTNNQSNSDLLNEMIKFAGRSANSRAEVTPEDLEKMRLMSIQLMLKQLQKQLSINQLDYDSCVSNIQSSIKQFRSRNANMTTTELKNKLMKSNQSDLMRKKWLRSRMDRISTQVLNFERIMEHIQDAETNNKVFRAMENANDLLKAMQSRQPSTSEVCNIMTEIEETMDEQTEMNDLLAEPMGAVNADIDDAALEQELADLEADDAILDMEATMPDVPTHIPQQDAIVTEEETNELTQIRDNDRAMLVE